MREEAQRRYFNVSAGNRRLGIIVDAHCWNTAKCKLVLAIPPKSKLSQVQKLARRV